ncbi:MAG: hypothetical protein WC593_03880 [Methanoregula sp.]
MKNMTLEKIYTKLANLDIRIYLMWLLLLLLLVLTIKLQYFSILFPIIFANIGIVLFLIFKRKNKPNTECETDHLNGVGDNSIQISGMIPVVSTILFLIIYSASLLSLFQGEYTKTVAYYLCISLCAGILIVEILSYRTQIQGYWILLKAVLLSINIVFANHLIFIQGISLPDFSLHFNVFFMSILNTGHLSSYPLGLYGLFPIHHIFASTIAIFTGYNPLSIYLLFGSFLIAIGVLFVFLIGKRFVNFQFGLVAALLFTCLDYYLMYGEHPEHQAYNYGFALICFTLIIYTYRFQKPAFYILFTISAFALVFTHYFTAAIVFVTVCSLIFFDIVHVHLLQKKDRSLPSKYILVILALFLFIAVSLLASAMNKTPVQLVSFYISPYFKDIYLLKETLFTSSVPVISIPSTPVPITSPPYVPPTGYDKLSLNILFENTLGSSLLVLVSILGFCSYIKKRFWFGDVTILNGILLSVLLGLGILFSYVFLLPDRLYPLLQIFCLVFLGAAGILWLYNVNPSRKKTFIIGCICILVVTMSFFSLASIINGFETSPFVGDTIAYEKLYTTSQDVSFGEWQTTFVPVNSYLVFDRTVIKTGILKSGNKFGQHTFTKINSGQLIYEKSNSSYYDNGLIIMMHNNP